MVFTEDVAEIKLLIEMHHKQSAYKGAYAATVECFRKADWLDLTFGLMRYGISKASIKAMNIAFPSYKFHRFLVKKSVQDFIKHPLNPLPMFKK